MSLIADIGRGLVQLVYPAACVVCDRLLEAGEFCRDCHDALVVDPHPTCPRCSSTIGPNLAPSDRCPRCRGEAFAFDSVVRGGPYDEVRRDVVLRMKHDEALAEAVGELWASTLARRLRSLSADVVVPVPLAWLRHWRRGFNQSAALASAVAHTIGRPIRPGWLRRWRATRPQTELSPTARRENLCGAFRASPAVRGKTVVLVDDVLTTGSTAHECARALKSAGAKSVAVAVFAHG